MKKYLILLPLLLFALVMQSYSQPLGFRQGLIIGQSGDTLICFVPAASAYGKKIAIKRSIDSEEEIIPLDQIKYLATATNVYENVAFKKKGKEIHKLMWLELEGTLNLYLELENTIDNTRYSRSGGMMTTFGKANRTYVIKKYDTAFLVEEQNFVEVISPLIADNDNLLQQVAAGLYSYKDIETLVKEYDGIKEPAKQDTVPDETDYIPAEAIQFRDSADLQIVHTDCDDRIFGRVATIPSIRGGENALADSLSLYLQQQNVSPRGKAVFTFLVTKTAAILSIEKISGNISAENKFREALLAYSNMWIPAVQHSLKVCAAVRVEVAFEKGKISLKILRQGFPI